MKIDTDIADTLKKDIDCLLPGIYAGGQSWRSGTKCDCKIGWLWVRSPLEKMKYLVTFIFSEASRGAAAQSVTVKPTGCGFDSHSRR